MRFGVLGAVELYDERGRSVPVGGPRQLALLAFLLVCAGRAVSNDELIEAVWHAEDPAGARKRLQVAVARLRRTLEGATGDRQLLRSTTGGYLLSVDADDTDVGAFLAGLAEGRRAFDAGDFARAAEVLREALALWRGPALADVAYEEFAQAEIRRLEELRFSALEARVEADLQLGRHAAVVSELAGLMATYPERERFAGQLMLAQYRCGRQADALEVYQDTRAHLSNELGLEPGPALTRLQTAILNQSPTLELAPDSVRPVGAAPPLPLTELFGRAADMNRLLRLVGDRRTRLVTLVGPGGVGKTRLAIELARHVAEDFADGARFVELAAVSDSDELDSAIGRALAVPIRVGEPPETALLRFLGDRHLLLVLDNFEQLVAGAGFVAELLGACPDLTIVVTSREPTRLAAERVHPVKPLDVPLDGDVPSAAELEGYGAVAMFCDRARATDPDFALDEATAPHVRDVCRRLDGLPLALELAAARVGLLCAADLAERLENALALLVGGARDAPERQRTLRATIDWSYRLLSDAERQAFARVAVFESGTTIPAAETITGASLDALGALVDKQLLVRRGHRLLMLETIRGYALERLAEDPEADAVRDRFAGWSLRFVRDATPHLVRGDRVAWVARLDAELPNALAALSWALDTGRAELALRLVGGLGDYWWHLYRWKEGLAWVERALQQAQGAPPRARAIARLYRARLTGLREATDRHREDLRSSLELFRTSDDAAGIAACLGHLAMVSSWAGDHEQARVLGDEALRCAQRSRDQTVLAFVLRASVAAANGYDDVSASARSALAYLNGAGDLWHAAWVCNVTAYRAITERRYETALPWLDRGLEAARRLDDRRSFFVIRANEGLARVFLQQPDQAAEAFRDALAACREAATEDLVDEPMFGLAVVTALQKDLPRAARLAGAARARTTGHGTTGAVIWSRLEHLLGPARIDLGAEIWDYAEREGAKMTVHEAIDFALA